MGIIVSKYEFNETGLILPEVYVNIEIKLHTKEKTIADVKYYFNKDKRDNNFKPFDIKQIHVNKNLDLSIKELGESLLELVYKEVKEKLFDIDQIINA